VGPLWHVLNLQRRSRLDLPTGTIVDDLQGLNCATVIYAAPNGKIVLGSYNLGVTIIDGAVNSIATIRHREGVMEQNSMAIPGPIKSIGADAAGNLWLGTSDGLLYYDWKTFKEYVKEPWLPSAGVLSLCFDHTGNLWLGTLNGIGVRCADGSAKLYTKADVLPGNFILRLLCAADGRVWALTDKGICVFDGKGWTYPVCKAQLPYWEGTMFQAADSALWFSTENGVVRNPTFTFQTTNPVIEALAQFKAKIEKEYPNVTPAPLVLKDAKGRIWAGREDGVDRYDGKAWTFLPLNLGDRTLAFIRMDSKGRVWIGTQGAGLFCYDGAEVVKYNDTADHSKSVIYDMVESRNGTLYFGTQHGLYVLKGETWTRQEGLEDIGCQQVHPMAIDDKDRLWMADCNYGVFLFDGKTATRTAKQAGLQGRQIQEIKPLTDGMVRIRTVTEEGREKSYDCDGETCTPVTDEKR
jgi:ligand-binding sensor domain-containing protein